MHARVGIAFVCNYPKGLCPTISVPSPVFDFSNCLTHPTESCHKHLPPFLKNMRRDWGGAGTRRRSTCYAPLRLPASAFLSAAPHPGTKVVSPGDIAISRKSTWSRTHHERGSNQSPLAFGLRPCKSPGTRYPCARQRRDGDASCLQLA